MIWLGALIAGGSLWLLGALTLSVLRARPCDAAHAVVADFVAGAAVLSVVGTTTVVLGLRLSLSVFYGLMLVVAAIAWRSGCLVQMPRFRLPRDRLTNLLLAGVVAIVVAIALASVRDRLWWDGWAIWAFKARVLFLDSTLTREFLGAAGYAFTHSDYPIAVPLIDWWIWKHAGTATASLVSLAGAVWFSLLPMLLWASLRDVTGERPAALAALGMAAFWPIAFYATGGTADVVIALAFLGAIVELDRAVRLNDAGAILRCAVFLTLGVLAKNEGLVIALIVSVVGTAALVHAGERRARRLLPFALPFVALAPWWIFASTLHVREAAVVPSLAGMLSQRITVFLRSLIGLALSVSWLPLPFIAAFGVTAALRGRERRLTAGWLILGGYFCVLCPVYLLTPHDMQWLLTTSLPRVLSVFVPPLIYLALASSHSDVIISSAQAT